MIQTREILYAITRRLDDCIPDVNIVTEDVTHANPELFPFFHVQILPMGVTPESGANGAVRTLLVDITYMEDSRSSNQSLYGVLDLLQEALGFVLDVGDRHITIEQMNPTIADDLAHLTFQLVFPDAVEADQEEQELFGGLDLRI